MNANIYHVLAILFVSTLSVGCAKLTNESTPAETATAEIQLPVSQQLPHYLERDIKDEIFYFVMPDRFHNGNPKNDNGDPSRPISYGGFDPTLETGFHGGDISGLEAKLGYLQEMGVTAIWMTPILRNKAVQYGRAAHHGYWVVDFTEIDPHFGTNDDLKSLIDAAHDRNIKVYFDIITNHTADVIKYKECHDEQGAFITEGAILCPFKTKAQVASGDAYTPFLLASETDAKVPAWLNDPSIYNNQGDSIWTGESVITGDFVGLDDINTSLVEVQQNMISVFEDLITNFKPDGFRIDTVKHVDLAFWQSFGPAIIEHAQSIGIPEFFIFGEVYDGNPVVLSTFTTAGKMPSVLDFGFHFNVKDALFTGMDINRLADLFDNDDFYRDHDSTPLELMNFLANHDVGRTGYFLEQGLPDIDEQEQLARSLLGHAFMYFSRGIPVVYYGDEQGFTGDAGDIDARENMDPSLVASYNDNNLIGSDVTTASDNFDQGHPIYQKLAELAQIRVAHPVLSKGEHHNRYLDNDNKIYAFSRVATDDRHEYIAIFNFGTEQKTVNFNVDVASYSTVSGVGVNVSNGVLSTTLPPLSYSLVRSSTPLPPAEIENIEISPMYEDAQRKFVPVSITTTNELAFNKMAVSFFAVDKEGNQTYLTTDHTYPYRAILLDGQLDGMTKLKVTVDNHDGQSVDAIVDL